MRFTMSFSARIQTAVLAGAGAGSVSACITVADFDDDPTVCQPLALTAAWKRYHRAFTVPSWMPATVSAAFLVAGASVELFLDDVELKQEPSTNRSSTCVAVNLLLRNPPADAMWSPGREIELAVRPSASCADADPGRAVAVTHDLVTPNGASLAAGAGSVRLGRSYTLILPANASGATLLAVTARDSSGGTIIAKQTFRMLVGAPLPPSHGARRRGFAFGSTIEWHVQAALLGSGLLEQQLAAIAALGINCQHVYLDEARQLQMLRQPFAENVAKAMTSAGVDLLFTLLPGPVIDGTCGQPGSPCAAQSPFPTSPFCAATVSALAGVPQPRPGKVTDALLERLCEVTLRLARRFSNYTTFWALDGEPQSNVK